MQNEPEAQKIFVGGGLTYELRETFQQFGEIVDFYVNYNRPFGFITFRHFKDAENAIKCMDDRYIDGDHLRVEWARGYPKNPPEYRATETQTAISGIVADEFEDVYNRTDGNNCTIHCKGLQPDTTVEMLEEAFNQFGEIEEITLHTQNSDYAFVRFNTKEAATLAICHVSCSEFEINGSIIECNWSLRPNFRSPDQEWSDVESTDSSSDSSRSSSESSGAVEDNFDSVFYETPLQNCTVYCGGLIRTITDELVREIFSPYGTILEIKLFVPRSEYGFIRFDTKEAATLAICAIDGKTPSQNDGWPIRCSWSHRYDHVEVDTESSTASSSTASAEPSLCYATAGLCIASPILPEDESQSEAKPSEEKPKTKYDLLCKICMEEELGIVFLECGHMTSCVKCAEKISICPVCRKRISRKVRTYMS